MSQSKKEMMNRALSAMTINIGKSGVNDNVIEEIKRQLKANEIVKLKFAKTVKAIIKNVPVPGPKKPSYIPIKRPMTIIPIKILVLDICSKRLSSSCCLFSSTNTATQGSSTIIAIRK